ncbi:MAG: phage holin family protein [Oscillospiraceae bacterium]|jgi:uncharacterized membrane protein YqgA involved in biofilm formation|nr:phage holin family protein [Oscillospiraceae bacterium]
MKINYIELLINIILASFGGIVKRITELEKHPEKKASFSYYIAGSIISVFVGIVVYNICKSFNISQFLTAGLTALSGYMGTPVLDFMSDIVKKRIEKNTMN